MRHVKRGRKFGRRRGERRAFLRNLLHELILRERIVTTRARAREVAPRMERLITIARGENLAARRLLERQLPPASAAKLAKTIAPRFLARRGGYTKIMKLTPRKSDGSEMAVIELLK